MTTLWPMEYVPYPEMGEVLDRELKQEEQRAGLASMLELDLDGLSWVQRWFAVQEALDRAETLQRPPTAAEAGDPVGDYDAGAVDGRDPDPRGWPGAGVPRNDG